MNAVFASVQFERRGVPVRGERVRDALEVGQGEDGVRTVGDLAAVDDVTRSQREGIEHELRVDALRAHHLDLAEGHRRTTGPRRRIAPGEELRLGQRVALEPGPLLEGRGAPLGDRVHDAVERGRADLAHLDHDLDVVRPQGLELLAFVGSDQHVERAGHQRQGRAQFVGGRNRVRNGHGDHDVRAGLPGDVHRDVACQATIAEDAPPDGHRREGAGHGHARAHRQREVPVAQHDHLAVLHVRRHGAERDRQLVEVGEAATARDEVLDRQVDVLRVDEAARRHHSSVADAELQAVAVGVAGELAAHRHLAAQSAPGDRVLPGDRPDRLLEFPRVHARGEGAADQRAHAGADDAVDRDPQLLEHAEHPDVRGALGAAATEREPDSGPSADRRCCCCHRIPGAGEHIRLRPGRRRQQGSGGGDRQQSGGTSLDRQHDVYSCATGGSSRRAMLPQAPRGGPGCNSAGAN
jgi:hypothetical protein